MSENNLKTALTVLSNEKEPPKY